MTPRKVSGFGDTAAPSVTPSVPCGLASAAFPHMPGEDDTAQSTTMVAMPAIIEFIMIVHFELSLGRPLPRWRIGALNRSWLLHLAVRPVVGFLRGIAAPAVERVVEQHARAELLEVVVVHARQAE